MPAGGARRLTRQWRPMTPPWRIIAKPFLPAFQQVEDNLAALRVLENEAQAENEAVKAAQNSLDISTYQYKAGTVNYLTVITEQAILLQDQVQALSILTRRMSSSVLLIEALGGGWNSSKLPTVNELKSGK